MEESKKLRARDLRDRAVQQLVLKIHISVDDKKYAIGYEENDFKENLKPDLVKKLEKEI